MVAVVEVFEHDLPVPGEILQNHCVRGPTVGQVVVFKVWLIAVEGRSEGRRLGVKVDENKSLPLLDKKA